MADGIMWQLATQGGSAIGKAIGSAPENYQKAQDWRRQRDIENTRKSILQQLAAGGDPFDPKAGGVGQLIRSGDLAGAAALAGIADKIQGSNSVYGTPIYGTRPDGSTGIGTFDKRGQFRQVETPGFQPTPGIRTIDTGTGTVVINSRSGAPVGGAMQPGQPQMGGAPQAPGYIPKDVQGEAQQKRFGTEMGERQGDLGKAKLSLDNSLNNLNQLQLQASELLGHSGLGRITGMAGILPNVPGFPGADAQAKLDTLKAKVGFATLQAMRDASKTGGALGQVSDFENRQLQNSMVELQNAQSEKQIKAALQKIIPQIEGMKGRLQQAYDTDYANIPRPNFNGGPGAPQGGAPSAPRPGTVQGGYRFRGGNPADQNSWEPVQ